MTKKVFINRFRELELLKEATAGLFVVFGRRRIGKTTLIENWSANIRHSYSQAIEANESIQIEQLQKDLSAVLPQGIVSHSWSEFFSLLSLIKDETIIVFDEFPYLVNSQPSLPSILQRFLDHNRPEKLTLVLLGSSQSMMHDLFLKSTSALYERATLMMKIEPMAYVDFCKYLPIDPYSVSSFELFSLIGGVPKYWQFIDSAESVIRNADKLFFEKSAYLESEPERLLKDENISGQQAKSILEAIGRGAHRPSEIASRLNVAQTALSKPLQILINTSLVLREQPFSESSRSSKRVLYNISDIALGFWYKVYSAHRSRWHLYSSKEKSTLIHQYASSVLENCFRSLYPDAQRYWEGKTAEFDSVRYNPEDLKSIIISEIKHTQLKSKERIEIEEKVTYSFAKSELAKKFSLAKVEVLDTEDVLDRMVTPR